MPYYLIADFQAGLDTRKASFSAPAGSLRKCSNAHITRGGEIEKRKAFAELANAAGTFGLHIVREQVFVFGSTLRPVTLPSVIQYQQLQAPNNAVMTAVLATASFNGNIYAVAEYADGNVVHFYDGTVIDQWADIAEALSGLDAVSIILAQQIEGETGLLTAAVGETVVITGSQNDLPFTVVPGPALTLTTLQTAGPDQPQITELSFINAYLPDVSYSVTIDGQEFVVLGRAAGAGRTAFTLQDRVLSTAQSLLRFSGFTDPGEGGGIPQPDPTRWDISGGIGAGFINLSTQDSGSETLTALAAYLGDLAVFSRQAVHIRRLSFDVANMSQVQLLRNIGTTSPRSVVSFGESDVFFLSESGVRSLRARDSSNSAASADIGTPIDDEVVKYLDELPASARTNAVGEVEPSAGRYCLSIEDRVYVYSQFPGSRISAWSSYDLGGQLTDMAATSNRLYVRTDDRVFLYGGLSGEEYDDVSAEIVLPFSDGGKPGTLKQITSIDVGCEGVWDVWIKPDPALPDYEEYVGEIEGTSYGLVGSIPANAQTTHVGFRFASKGTGPASIGQVIYHYRSGDES